nr:MAG TPA: helix-turn-helix domain protein [Caudoviricetes sp.]
MTQKQLAEAVGCSPKDICRWELGKCEPRINSLLRLAEALNCTVDELLKDL